MIGLCTGTTYDAPISEPSFFSSLYRSKLKNNILSTENKGILLVLFDFVLDFLRTPPFCTYPLLRLNVRTVSLILSDYTTVDNKFSISTEK